MVVYINLMNIWKEVQKRCKDPDLGNEKLEAVVGEVRKIHDMIPLSDFRVHKIWTQESYGPADGNTLVS